MTDDRRFTVPATGNAIILEMNFLYRGVDSKYLGSISRVEKLFSCLLVNITLFTFYPTVECKHIVKDILTLFFKKIAHDLIAYDLRFLCQVRSS